jgi:hypothetical protein
MTDRAELASDTPRTDDAIEHYGSRLQAAVPVEFARQLERELAAATQAQPSELAATTRLLAEFQIKYAAEKNRALELEAKLAAAEADAGRYRWLRHGDNDDICIRTMHEGDVTGPQFSAFLLRNKELDAAIDAAIAAEQTADGKA